MTATIPTHSSRTRPAPASSSARRSAADRRLRQLNAVSITRAIDPAVAPDLAGHLGEGQVLPDELLSVAGLELELTEAQRARLSREEVASCLLGGIEFEAVLIAGFGLELATRADLRDPRATYALHEIGEETRHSRMFIELVQELDPTARNPLRRRPFTWIQRAAAGFIIRHPATFHTLVLGGEEIPDLLQQRASEHPDTDPHLAAVNRYHRLEEARHLAFARLRLAELWVDATAVDRWGVRRLAPLVIGGMWDLLVHPGVYETVGLPGWATWRAVRRDPARVALRHRACRPVLNAMLDAGVFRAGRIPAPWRRLCGVDRHGNPC